MHVFSKGTLRQFWEQHPDSQGPLEDWYRRASRETWASPADVRERYANVSFVANDRVIFRFKGGTYRLIVRVFYPARQVYIRFIGTHAEYDRINAEEV